MEIFNDTKHGAVYLRQLSFLLVLCDVLFITYHIALEIFVTISE